VRPRWQRVLLTLLGLLLPGWVLIWFGRLRAGLAFLLIGQAMFLFTLPPLWLLPTTRDHEGWALAWLAGFLVLGLLVSLWSAILVWRASRLRALPRPYQWRWPFWCTLAAFIAFAIVAPDGAIHGYVMTSRSMAPTLAVGERIWADQRMGQTLARGDLVIVLDDSNFARVERIVGLGGDRVALKDGVVILGGEPVPQRAAPEASAGAGEKMLMEQLPGRPAHRILDTAATPQDDMAEQLVPKAHVFVLGDNRDDSLDSRFPAAMNGLGMVHQDRLLGRVFLIYWSDDRARIGSVP